MKLFVRVGRLFLFTYLGLMGLLAGCQNRLLYVPTRESEAVLVAKAGAEGLEPWRDAHGTIIGWHQPNPNAKKRLVVFHGNAGNAVNRSYYADGFGGQGFEVYLFEYPGYGSREGSPGKKEFLESGRTALNELLAADSRPLYLLGESIGSGTSCALAGELDGKVAGVVLVVPLCRLAEVAAWHFPYLPVGLILHDRYDNAASLEKYHGPVAFVVADHDEVVSTAQGLKLHAAYTGPKLLITLPNSGHNSFPIEAHESWWQDVAAFLERSRKHPH